MKLLSFLMRKNMMPPGHILRGKKRLVPTVYPFHLRKAREEMQQELENMHYLRYPYLTKEESSGHAMALGKAAARRKHFQEMTRSQFKPDVAYMDRLNHLNTLKVWD